LKWQNVTHRVDLEPDDRAGFWVDPPHGNDYMLTVQYRKPDPHARDCGHPLPERVKEPTMLTR
jgi:hypothetical protein